jgi:hypothetical protein
MFLDTDVVKDPCSGSLAAESFIGSVGHNSSARDIACYVLLAIMLAIGGCSKSVGRQSLEGTVTFDGKPLEKGQITFVPQGDTKGPTAGAEIVGGKFAIPAAGGTFTGKFRVEITASRSSGKKVADRTTGKPVDVYEQFIPKKYNVETQLTADVAGGEENRLEFALKSKS